jgi:uncharacterized protein (TIGR03435 family)
MRVTRVIRRCDMYAVLLVGVCTSAVIQKGSSEEPLSFEVATIKPSRPDGSTPANVSKFDPLRFTRVRSNLNLLVADAYDLADYQVTGGPSWAATDQFDIEAKPAGHSTPLQMRQMLHTLLVDRFQLMSHHEMRSVDAYSLILAKRGPRIGPQFHVHQDQEGDPNPVRSNGGLAMHKTMKDFANIISIYLRHPFPSSGALPEIPYDPLPVIDQTRLAGDYDIVVDLQRSRDWAEVLNEQLGLSLVRRRVSVENVHIDRASKPGEN